MGMRGMFIYDNGTVLKVDLNDAELFFFKILFIHARHRERQRHRKREKQAPRKKLDAGHDPRTPGS